MKISLIVTAISTAAAFAMPAAAADFTGPRAEVHLGWDQLGVDHDGLKGHEDNVAYGFGVGYDMPLGSMLVGGVEANLDFSEISRTDRGTANGTAYSAHVKAGRDIDISARFGTMIGDNFLLYGKAGYSNSRLKVRTTAGSASLGYSENNDGLRLGAGGEFAFGQAFAKVEYRYTNYESGFDRDQVFLGLGWRF